jgi:hypothetical protein
MRAMRVVLFFFTTLLLFAPSAFETTSLSDGFVITGAYGGKSTVLLDKFGATAYSWQHDSLTDVLNGYSCYLMENGDLLRTAQVPQDLANGNMAPKQGAINQVDPAGKIVWRYTLANDTFMLHHDMKILPNGNILAVAFTVKSKAQMIAAGVDTALLSGGGYGGGGTTMLAERIIEIKPKLPEGGDIVWMWDIFDHVSKADLSTCNATCNRTCASCSDTGTVARNNCRKCKDTVSRACTACKDTAFRKSASSHPELFSGRIVSALFSGQWTHLNGIDYNAKLDLIVFSSRVFSECYVIDHSTTTALAATHAGGKRGKGGDLLYRWGKTGNYGMTGGYAIDCLHSTTWVPETYPGAGHICFYHNNINAGKSEVIEITPPMDDQGNIQSTAGQIFGPAQPTWKFAPAKSFFSQYMSSAMRMPNGNTIIHEAYPNGNTMSMDTGIDTASCSRLWEVDKDGNVVWQFRMLLKSDPSGGMGGGFQQAWNPAKIMYYPSTYVGIKNLFSRSAKIAVLNAIKGKLLSNVKIKSFAGRVEFENIAGCEIKLFSMQGKCVYSHFQQASNFSLNSKALPAGVYSAKVVKDKVVAKRVVTILPY